MLHIWLYVAINITIILAWIKTLISPKYWYWKHTDTVPSTLVNMANGTTWEGTQLSSPSTSFLLHQRHKDRSRGGGGGLKVGGWHKSQHHKILLPFFRGICNSVIQSWQYIDIKLILGNRVSQKDVTSHLGYSLRHSKHFININTRAPLRARKWKIVRLNSCDMWNIVFSNAKDSYSIPANGRTFSIEHHWCMRQDDSSSRVQ